MSKFDELDGFNQLHGYWLDDLTVGQQAVSSRTITEAAVEIFGGLSGDLNPTHFSDDFASKERFGKRIVHGMLTTSHITGTLAAKLPGPGCLYMGQTVKFVAPVNIGDTVTTVITITDINPKGKVTLKTDQFVGDKQCVDGEATLWVPARPKK
uniref:3-hydroxybutyryl-CoA dehydratase n=1 Tax=Candidatus Kentrum sp. DK TaxID=2126562 RepID=A0A450S2I3_9GAMM|nr:MAG: 3-hydroxybutyryl-CoA dehydratase [Candidatus Kentron sp. DK]VFJ49199.1 MAG: 3-hydroxybutyryl-CoA dehydratase [Candidatus Kentron sp. DK]